MASSPAVADGSSLPTPAPAAKAPLMSMIVATLLAVIVSIVAVGGVVVYLIKSGRLPVQKTITVEAKAEPLPNAPGHTLSLDSLVANLADAGGAAYLKMSLNLKIADEPVKKGAKEEKAPAKGAGMSDDEAGVRDTVLMVVGHQTAEGLLAPEGKEHLKAELKRALADHNPELKVMEIHFTDFLVQR